MIGNSVALTQALDHISRAAPINRPVLIIGERGTGKELAAARLHFLSPRWEQPLIKVNCAAIAETLLESELFGHEVGSFTGATRAQRGRFERADGGTLFLDELATMSPRLQEKLLRLIEYGEFERVGGQQTRSVDVRIVAATNANLPQLADEQRFRHDLLDRLSFDVVHLPALRQRRDDIEDLAQHFAIGMAAELGWDLFPGFSAAALNTLREHSWAGNIRELKNTVERSLYRWPAPTTTVDTIVLDPFINPYESPAASQAQEANNSSAQLGENSSSPATAVSEPHIGDFGAHIAQIERKILTDTLLKNGHNQKRTAQALALSYDQLRGLLRKHKLPNKRGNS